MYETLINTTIRDRAVLEIEYQNGRGETTCRRIRPHRSYRTSGGLTYVEAWCEKRGEDRTFRTDRIKSALGYPPPTGAPRGDRGAGRMLFAVAVICACIIVLSQVVGSSLAGSSRARSEPPPARAPQSDGIYALTAYRGLRIHRVVSGGRTTFEAPDWAISKASYQEVHYAVNSRKFRAATGIASSTLESRYAGADYDSNSHLAWFEIKRFQAALVREFEYRHNDIALRPDQFLTSKGGDCEDFALYTAGLLRYWGWNNWIGGIYDAGGYVGHAVCLVKVGDDVPSKLSFYLEPRSVKGYSSIPTGRYIPIDYASVGSLSSAADATDRLVYIWVPEEIYGERM